jgi:hypothetical protein
MTPYEEAQEARRIEFETHIKAIGDLLCVPGHPVVAHAISGVRGELLVGTVARLYVVHADGRLSFTGYPREGVSFSGSRPKATFAYTRGSGEIAVGLERRLLPEAESLYAEAEAECERNAEYERAIKANVDSLIGSASHIEISTTQNVGAGQDELRIDSSPAGGGFWGSVTEIDRAEATILVRRLPLELARQLLATLDRYVLMESK